MAVFAKFIGIMIGFIALIITSIVSVILLYNQDNYVGFQFWINGNSKYIFMDYMWFFILYRLSFNI